MNANGNMQPYTIYLGADDARMMGFESSARAQGLAIKRLDLAGLSDNAALADYLAREFEFPHETRGLDAVIDMVSDLEWLKNKHGYLVIVRGRTAMPSVLDALASLLPNILDRWRTQGMPFVIVIDVASERLERTLHAANRLMKESGSLPWAQPGTGAVDVLVLGSREAEVDG